MRRMGLSVAPAVLVTVAAFAWVTVAPGQGRAPSSGTPPAGPTETSPAKKAPADQALVSVRDGRLTLRVQNRPLHWVLQEISRRARVAIVGRGTVGGHMITAEFKDLLLEEGLRLLLKDRTDYFLFYGADPKGDKPTALQAVWVYPRGRGRGLEPAPLEESANVKELKERLRDQDPTVRTRAIGALVEREGARAQQETLEALKDPDPGVRREALWWAVEEGVTVPDERLRELAMTDPERDVRVQALRALSGKPGVREIAERALQDPDPYVRSVAQETLRRLDMATRTPRAPHEPTGGTGVPGVQQSPPHQKTR